MTNGSGTKLESDYENILENFQKLSLYPTTEDELLYIRQRISSISVWEIFHSSFFFQFLLLNHERQIEFSNFEFKCQTFENRYSILFLTSIKSFLMPSIVLWKTLTLGALQESSLFQVLFITLTNNCYSQGGIQIREICMN